MPRGSVDSNSVVYSAGLGEDATFDHALIEQFGCDVFAFDPTPRAIAFASGLTSSSFHFVPFGVWSADGEQFFAAPSDPTHVSHSVVPAVGEHGFRAECRSIPSFMREFGHEQITLLKLDVEGAEHVVVPAMFGAGISPSVLCVEFHGGVWRAAALVRTIRAHGYQVQAVERWNVTFRRFDA